MSTQFKNVRKFNRVTQNDIVDTLTSLHGIGRDTAQDVASLVDATAYDDLLNDERTDLKGCVKKALLTSQINRESVLAVVLYQAQKQSSDEQEVILYKGDYQ